MNRGQMWIDRLQMQRHPEGGWYREVCRSAETIPGSALPSRFGGDRSFYTVIYFLLQGDDVSALHRIRQDEVWHFHDGSPLTVHSVDGSGKRQDYRLGRDFESGQHLVVVVPAGVWFGARGEEADSFSLVSCTVAPGFDFADFEMGDRDTLVQQFPGQRSLIERLTRQGPLASGESTG